MNKICSYNILSFYFIELILIELEKMESRSLYGGAISVDFPTNAIDIRYTYLIEGHR